MDQFEQYRQSDRLKALSYKGGKRPGAGRPKGSPNKAPLDRLRRIMVDGHTPLEVILSNMRTYYKAALARELEAAATVKGYIAHELRAQALDAAVKAAPYCHSRHSHAIVRHEVAVTELTDDELAMIAGRGAKLIEHEPQAAEHKPELKTVEQSMVVMGRDGPIRLGE